MAADPATRWTIPSSLSCHNLTGHGETVIAGMVNSRAVILLSVSVPVLSEQIAETEPSVSTDGSRLTMAPRLASARVPMEYIVVTTAGRPGGV